MKLLKLKLYALGLLITGLSVACSKRQQSKPNVVILLIDDAGYADFGFAGSKDLQTPNIDKLAESGVVFSDAHVTASVCGPSRAGLLSGLYQQRFGFECNPPSHDFCLDTSIVLLPSILKAKGYATSAFGKWHLGHIEGCHPNDRGFDFFYGFLSGGRSYFFNNNDDEPGHVNNLLQNKTQTKFSGYLTDVLAERAVQFIEENKHKPFFMYWAPNAVHTPMEAKEDDLNKFSNHPRQVLAEMTWSLDRAIGEIINKLDKENLLENTLIFFLSDNGGAHNNQSSNLPLKGFKGNKFEGGHRVPFVVSWPKVIKNPGSYSGLSSSLDVFATSIAAAKAEVSDLDGVDLIPYLNSSVKGNPHDVLFWRKDKFAAVRRDSIKLIRVENLGYALYNLTNDLSESNNLASDSNKLQHSLSNELIDWEKCIDEPLWFEGAKWDSVTWLIHQDLYLNREVRVKNPSQLKRHK